MKGLDIKSMIIGVCVTLLFLAFKNENTYHDIDDVMVKCEEIENELKKANSIVENIEYNLSRVESKLDDIESKIGSDDNLPTKNHWNFNFLKNSNNRPTKKLNIPSDSLNLDFEYENQD